MSSIIQFHVTKGERFYTASCLQLPIVTQALTLDELSNNIEEALALHLEDENLAQEYGSVPTVLVSFELSAKPHAKTEDSLRR